jgi:hypothetical protein
MEGAIAHRDVEARRSAGAVGREAAIKVLEVEAQGLRSDECLALRAGGR